jgi:hypothetical protein
LGQCFYGNTPRLQAKVNQETQEFIGLPKPDLRSAWLDITPVLGVDRVHCVKVVHVGQEDVDLDDLGDVCSGSLKDIGQVLDALVLRSADNGQPGFWRAVTRRTTPSPKCAQGHTSQVVPTRR